MQPSDPFDVFHRGIERLAELPGLRGMRRRAFERQFFRHVGSNLYRGVFDSFSAARDSIPATVPQGYDHEGAAQLYKERTKRIYPSDYPVIFWLQQELTAGARKIFDVGGHIGIGFYAYQRYVKLPADLTWTVHEVQAVADEGRRFADQQGVSARLRFTTTFDGATGADLLFAAGSLQYLPDDLATLLAKLPERPKRLLLNLVPLHPTKRFYTVQSFGTAVSPYRVDSFQSFTDGLRNLGYEMEDLWQNAEKSCQVQFEPELSLDKYHGMLLRLPD